MKKNWWIHLAFWAFIATGTVYGVKRYFHYQRKEAFAQSLNIAKKAESAEVERAFVVIVTSFNNQEYAGRNLDSIIDQEYENFRVIYIDDCSTDSTYDILEKKIKKSNLSEKFTLIRNGTNLGAMENIFRSVHECRDDEIVVLVDGDDWLASHKVLETLNLYYEDPDVWITYGNYLNYPEYSEGINEPVSSTALTDQCLKGRSFRTSHLRTFYAGLFKTIKIENFLHKGKFFPVCSSEALMLPMIERAQNHLAYIPEILYVQNLENPLADRKTHQDRIEYYNGYIRGLNKNEVLVQHPSSTDLNEDLTDIIVFSYDRPLQLFAFLESLETYGKGYGNVFVIYRASNKSYSSAYGRVKDNFRKCSFVKQSNSSPHKNFKPLVIDYVFNNERSHSPYITFAVDDIVIKDEIDFSHAVSMLQKYQAYGFYFRLGTTLDYCYMNNCRQKFPHFISLGGKLKAWQFSTGTGDWDYQNTLDLAVYSKKEIFSDLSEMKYTYPNTFEEEWAKRANHKRVGLCYESSKMVNIPLNIVSEYNKNNRQMRSYSTGDLLKYFQEGKKIDISKLYKIENHSAHIEYNPDFIVR